ncbi:LysE family translocator [Isoptericola sp. NPDC056618]|uniref:LysE family translocator n=1 Tax=Isoptericola sp. NPDC056618 TaxID=3345878 RepID=UPI0036BF5A85
MEQFLAVAVAHFLALLIPGVDFFLIARTTMTSGWRSASGACVGIACANGVFVTVAFCGLSVVTNPTVLLAVQGAGGVFLVVMGIAFLRARVDVELAAPVRVGRTSWTRSLGLGFASGLLNPKNALFYASLAATLTAASAGARTLYGAWMVAVVLAWDLFVAVALGSERALARLARLLPWLTRAAGGVLGLLGLGMIGTLAASLVG